MTEGEVTIMRALERMESPRAYRGAQEEKIIRFPGPADRERVAQVLSDLMEESRKILEQLEERLGQVESLQPGERVQREVLRFLARQEDWVDFHDIPPVGALGRAGARSFARALAERGLVDLERDATYPNMIALRITPGGREELRRMGVAEAMEYLGERNAVIGRVEEAAEEALEALRRMVESI
jgi:hypothetical protein